MDDLEYRQSQRLLSSFEGPLVHGLTRSDEWTRRFGTSASPRAPWDTARVDGCLLGVASPGVEDAGHPMRKSLRIWATFPLASLRAVCRDGDLSPLRGQREPLAECRLGNRPQVLMTKTDLELAVRGQSDGRRPGLREVPAIQDTGRPDSSRCAPRKMERGAPGPSGRVTTIPTSRIDKGPLVAP